MARPNLPLRGAPRRIQRGLTLVEFMVSIAIGLLLVAAVATLIASQSGNRAEVERAGRLIENGRYGIRSLTDDLEMAGYWGELNTAPTGTPLTALPDPCALDLATLEAASQLHVQGYSSPVSSAVPTCLNNYRTDTDILVVRHADPDTTAWETGGVTNMASLAAGQLYVQTGLNPASTFAAIVRLGGTAADNTTNFTLLKKDKVTRARVRKMVTRIYYVANCSVEVAGSCTGADGGNPIPSLKMIELTVTGAGAPGWSPAVTIAEGIEMMQIDYGQDTNGDGSPDGDDVSGTALTHTTWQDVMAVKIHLLARSTERSPEFSDAKTYPLGTYGTFTPATADLGYKRHAFVQSVRLVNPSARRSS